MTAAADSVWTEETEAPQAQWALVEVMGHRFHAGKVSEEVIAGSPFLKVEALTVAASDASDERWETIFYQPHSLFALTPCSEERARQSAPKFYPPGPAALALDPGRYPIDDEDVEHPAGCECDECEPF